MLLAKDAGGKLKCLLVVAFCLCTVLVLPAELVDFGFPFWPGVEGSLIPSTPLLVATTEEGGELSGVSAPLPPRDLSSEIMLDIESLSCSLRIMFSSATVESMSLMSDCNDFQRDCMSE